MTGPEDRDDLGGKAMTGVGEGKLVARVADADDTAIGLIQEA